MNNINEIYCDIIIEILKNGFEYNDPNRKGVTRKQITDYHFKWKFEDGFPIIGVKKCYPNQAFNEFKMFMMGYNDNEIYKKNGVNFWSKDAERGFTGKQSESDLGRIYPIQIREFNGEVDQLKNAIRTLQREPHTTKVVVTMLNPSDYDKCALTPCHTRFAFLVSKLQNEGLGLQIQFTMDSVDVFLGLPMNIMYYANACLRFAHYLGMEPIGIIADLYNVHLYDNSIDAAVRCLLKLETNNFKKIEFETDFPEPCRNIDAYLANSYPEQIKLLNYEYAEVINVEMLPYSYGVKK